MPVDTHKGAVIRHSVLRSTISNYVTKAFTLGIGFLLTPFILRQLGATTYGLFVLVGSVIAYGGLLDFGMTGAIIKYVAAYRAKDDIKQAKSLVATALWFYIVLGVLTIVLSAIIAPLFPIIFNVAPTERSLASWLVLLMGVGVGISIPCSTSIAVLHGLHRFDLANIISISGTILSTTATVAVLLLGGGVLGMVAVGILVTLIMQIPSIRLVRRAAPDLEFGWRGASLKLARTVVPFSSSLFIVHLSGQLSTQTDEIVIGASMPLRAVTPYAIARRLSEVAQILTDQFMKVLMPLASQLDAEGDKRRLIILYVTGTRLTLAIFFPIACTLIVLAAPILRVWVGDEYSQYAYLVIILTVASLIDTSQWPAGAILQGMNRHQPLVLVSIGTALLNLTLSISLIPRFGLAGVALGTLIPTVIECFAIVLPYAMQVIGVSIKDVMQEIIVPTMLPAIPMAVALYTMEVAWQPASLPSIAVTAGVGVLIYGAVYLSIGASFSEQKAFYDFVDSAIRRVTARRRHS